MTTSRIITNTATGMQSGFAIGSAFGGVGGPVGAAVGGTIGLVESLLGLGSSGSGGGGFKKKDIKQALKATDEWELENIQEAFAVGIRGLEEATRLYDYERDRQYDQALQDLRGFNDIRTTNYNQAFDLFIDSNKAADLAIDINNQSAEIAINNAERLRNDRLFELGIAQQQIFIQDEIFAAQSELSDSLIQSQMSSSIELANLNAQSIENQISTQLAVGAAELQAQEFSIAADMVNLRAQGEAALAQGELKMDDILLNLDRQIAEADTAQQLLRLSLDDTRANAAIQTDQARREGLLAEGAQIAKGQAGRSAGKSAQVIAFQSEQAQALLANAIVRADAKYLIDKNAIVKQLEFAREQGKNQLEAAAIEADLSAAQMTAAGLNMQAQSAQLDARAAQMAGAVTGAGLQLDQLSVELLSSQTQLQGQLASNAIARAEAAAASSLSLTTIEYAKDSAMDQYMLDKEAIEWELWLGNQAANSQRLEEPVQPELLPPPPFPPDLVLDPIPDMDWKGLEKLMDKNKKAGIKTNLASLTPEISQLLTSLETVGAMAENLNQLRVPDVTQDSTNTYLQAAQSFSPITSDRFGIAPNQYSTGQVQTDFGLFNPSMSVPSNPYTSGGFVEANPSLQIGSTQYVEMQNPFTPS